jgi:hypothetical protein
MSASKNTQTAVAAAATTAATAGSGSFATARRQQLVDAIALLWARLHVVDDACRATKKGDIVEAILLRCSSLPMLWRSGVGVAGVVLLALF